MPLIPPPPSFSVHTNLSWTNAILLLLGLSNHCHTFTSLCFNCGVSDYWTYHICFLWEYSISQTLISHPLYRKLDTSSLLLSNVALCIGVLRQAKISHLDDIILIQPTYMEHLYHRWFALTWKGKILHKLSKQHTCSFWLQDLCAPTCVQWGTPFLWQSEGTCQSSFFGFYRPVCVHWSQWVVCWSHHELMFFG